MFQPCAILEGQTTPDTGTRRQTRRAGDATGGRGPGRTTLLLLACMNATATATGVAVANLAGRQRNPRQPDTARDAGWSLGGSVQDLEAAAATELQAQWDSASSWSPDSPLANCSVPPVSMNFVLPNMRVMLPVDALDGLSAAVSSAIRSASLEYGFKHYMSTASLEAGLQVLDDAGLTVRVDMCATGTPAAAGGATAVAEASPSSTDDVSLESAGIDDVDDSGNARVELWEVSRRSHPTLPRTALSRIVGTKGQTVSGDLVQNRVCVNWLH